MAVEGNRAEGTLLPHLPKFTRRHFLETSGQGIVLSLIPPDFLPRYQPESQGVETDEKLIELRRSVESLFGVELRTGKELYKEAGKPFPPDMQRYAGTMSFQDVMILAQCLQKLPRHFTTPYAGKPLRYTLYNDAKPEDGIAPGSFLFTSTGFEEDELAASKPGGLHPKAQHHIQLAFRSKVVDPNQHVITVAHEDTHKQTQGYPSEILAGKRPNYFKIVEDILGGGPFFFRSTELLPGIDRRYEELLQTPYYRERGRTRELYFFYHALKYGLTGDISPSEFTAVLGERYIFGQDYFLRHYGEFFGRETAKSFYNFIRDDIFQGKEYQEGEIRLQEDPVLVTRKTIFASYDNKLYVFGRERNLL